MTSNTFLRLALSLTFDYPSTTVYRLVKFAENPESKDNHYPSMDATREVVRQLIVEYAQHVRATQPSHVAAVGEFMQRPDTAEALLHE